MSRLLIYITVTIAVCLSYYSCAGGTKSGDGNDDAARLFKQNCSLCHGSDGRLGLNGAKDLRLSELDLPSRIVLITKGKGNMLGFEHALTSKQIEALAKYTLTFK